jgi:hypothetical protein
MRNKKKKNPKVEEKLKKAIAKAKKDDVKLVRVRIK